MIPDKDWPMYQAMIRYGGGFIQSFAECLNRADHVNYAKLETAFPEYFAEYRKIGEEMKETGLIR
jgi:hypothetical protein